MTSSTMLVKSGVVMFVAAIFFGYLEPVVKALKVTGSSELMNSTIDSIANYTWRGLLLGAISLIVLGAADLMGYISLIG